MCLFLLFCFFFSSAADTVCSSVCSVVPTYISLQHTYIHMYLCMYRPRVHTYVMSLQTICFFSLPQSGRLRDERGGRLIVFV